MAQIDKSFHVLDDVQAAKKSVEDIVTGTILPLIVDIKRKLLEQPHNSDFSEEQCVKLTDVFTLCCSQIRKCVIQLLNIFESEHRHGTIFQDSRLCILERLSWCTKRLESVNNCLNKNPNQDEQDQSNESILTIPMYFVNWIDHTFNLLTSLSNLVNKPDFEAEQPLNVWKDEVINCVTSVQATVDELILSSMMLGKYCLPSDQHVITVKCQVVLQEVNILLTELVNLDVENGCKLSIDSLKMPLMPSNINVLIDILKDALYALETNTNTALLGLLIHCFCNNISPLDKLKSHFKNGAENCECNENTQDIIENCLLVKEFDLYSERLLQIGSFAVSCSSDQKRILSLRSGLASLEALDPHLVPCVMMLHDSHHTNMLVRSWHQEVQEIRGNVFLIVDPAAFSEKCKQMLHVHLFELIDKQCYDNALVTVIINIGCLILNFFAVYTKFEPDALTQGEKLRPLLYNLDKAQLECKIVSNMLIQSDKDFLYDVKVSKNRKKPTLDTLFKRLKLIHTLVNRISELFELKENDEHIFGDEAIDSNLTCQVSKVNAQTFVKNSKKPCNVLNTTRSIFGRNSGINTPRKAKVSNISQHFKHKDSELNFSAQINELFRNINFNDTDKNELENIRKTNVKEESILYNYSPMKNKMSLRKAFLSRNCFKTVGESKLVEKTLDQTFDKSDVDITCALQITEILDQLTDMSMALSTTKQSTQMATHNIDQNQTQILNKTPLNLNTSKAISKNMRNIPVNTESKPVQEKVCLDHTNNVSTLSKQSNVNTLERLKDIDMLYYKLSNLKYLQRETSL